MSFQQQSNLDLRENLHLFADTCSQRFDLTLSADKIYAGDIHIVEHALKVLYQTPSIFEKMLFRIGFNFTNIEHSNMFIPDFYWKSDIAYFRWFHQLSRVPAILFFINDPETRFYILAGDMLAEKSLEVYSADELVSKWNEVEIDQQNEIINLVVENSISLIRFGERYCFKTEKYITRLINGLNLQISYEEIYEKYYRDTNNAVVPILRNVA